MLDIVSESRWRKMRWVGHVASFTDNQWTAAVSEWYPHNHKRLTGQPPKRREDFVVDKEEQMGKERQRQEKKGRSVVISTITADSK